MFMVSLKPIINRFTASRPEAEIVRLKSMKSPNYVWTRTTPLIAFCPVMEKTPQTFVLILFHGLRNTFC